MKKNTQRVFWIDQLRGIAIFLVILGHVELPDKINGLIYSFHMPLFFMITGLTMKNEKLQHINMKEYIVNQIKNLIIPYFWMSFMMYPLWYLVSCYRKESSVSVLQVLKGIFLGNSLICVSTSNALWFVLVLFLAKILYVILCKMTKDNIRIMTILVIVSAVLGVVEQGKVRIWHWNVVFTAVVFIYVGNCMMQWYQKRGEAILQNLKKRKFCLLLAVLFLIGIMSAYFNGRVSMNRNTFGNFVLLFYITAIAFSSVCMLSVIKLLPTKENSKSIIVYIGKNSLLYVGCHIPVLRVLEYFLSDSLVPYWGSILESIVVYFGLVLLCVLINRYFPYVSGKKIVDMEKKHVVSKVLLLMWCAWIPYAHIIKQSGINVDNKVIQIFSLFALLGLSTLIVKVVEDYFPAILLENVKKESNDKKGYRPTKE